MKKLNLKITTIAVASALTIIAPTQSFAWKIVYDPVNWLLNYSEVAGTWKLVYESFMQGLRQDATNTTIRAGNDLTTLQMEQDNALVQVDDARERRMYADQLTLEKDNALRPTIEKCVEITKVKTTFGGGGQQYMASGGSLSGIRNNTAPGPELARKVILAQMATREENTRTSLGGARAIIEGKQSLGTCEGTNPINGCTGEGSHPGADRNVLSWFGNVDKNQVRNGSVTVNGEGKKTSLAIANFSLDGKGVAIAATNAANLVGVLPTKLTHEQAKKAPIYQSMWETFMNRQSAVSVAATNVSDWRTSQSLDGAMSSVWNGKYKSLYQQYFPNLQAPANPSQIDFLKVITMDMYAKSSTEFETTDPATQAAINTSINNLLVMRQLEKQDVTNTLLASILAQQLNPLDTKIMENERMKVAADKN